MRGYFAIGIENVSKAGNIGNLIRTAHAFGAAFAFTLRADITRRMEKFDTAKSATAMPVYQYDALEEMRLPGGCRLVGVELCADAVDLPSFRHPAQCAYILGGERSSLSQNVLEACDFVVKIPTRFSLNVATAGAIVMYDRMRTLGRFAPPPVTPSGRAGQRADHTYGAPRRRT